MNKYLISQKIITPSHIDFMLRDGSKPPQFKMGGFAFTPWNFSFAQGSYGDAWVASKIIQSDKYSVALYRFRRDLSKIIPRIAYVSQCSMDFYHESYIVKRINNNNERIFLFRHVHDEKPVGLPFRKEEIQSAEKLKSLQYQIGLRFLQESSNTERYIPKLVMLFASLEALCGKVDLTKADGSIVSSYSRDIMKEILGGTLMNELFGPGGIRHKLNHGELPDFGSKDYVREIYQKILSYINKYFKTTLNPDVVSPQRHFYGNYKYVDLPLKPLDKSFEVDLVSLEENLDKEKLSADGYEYAFSEFDMASY